MAITMAQARRVKSCTSVVTLGMEVTQEVPQEEDWLGHVFKQWLMEDS